MSSTTSPQSSQQEESPLAYVRQYSSSTNQYLQQSALLYSATTDVVTLPIALGPSGPTAYLGAFINAMEQLMSDAGRPDQYKLGGFGFLVSKIIPKVSPQLIQHLLDRIGTLFINTLRRFADISFIAKVLLQCISATLLQLPSTTIQSSQTCKSMIQALYIFAVDPRPKIRKPAQLATERVFRTLSNHSETYQVPKQFQQTLIDFCKLEFAVTESTIKDCTSALYLCGLLQGILYTLNTQSIAAVLAPLLALTAQGNQYLLLQTFHTITSLYSKGFEYSTCLTVLEQSLATTQTIPTFLKDFESNIKLTTAQRQAHIEKDVEFTYQLLLSVLDLKPNLTNPDGSIAFNNVITAMYRTLYSFNPHKAMSQLVNILNTLQESANAERDEIVASSLSSIKHIITITLSTHRLDSDINDKDITFTTKKTPTVAAILIFIRQLFMLPNLDTKSLLTILDIIISSMTHAKQTHFEYYKELLIIVETYHSKTHGDDTVQTACERVLGEAISRFTPELMLTILPLNLPSVAATKDMSDSMSVGQQLQSSRIWLLQLYPQYVRNASLSFFQKVLLPIANDAYQLSLISKAEKRVQEYDLLHVIITTIWNSFPSFCLMPKDVDTSFKGLMKELVNYYNSDQFATISQQPICRGLRNLCSKNLAIVNGRWGMQDDLGLQRSALDDDDLVLLHTPNQLKMYLNRANHKKDDDDDDDSDDENNDDNDDNNNNNDDDSDDDDDENDRAALYNQITSRAKKRSRNNLYNKNQSPPPITIQQAQKNCDSIGSLSKIILPLLFNTLINIFSENHILTPQQAQFIPILLDTVLAYTCTATPDVRQALFTTAFEQFLQLSQEITRIYQSIDDYNDNDDDDDMPSLDSAMSRPKLSDAELPIRKCRALSDILVSMSPALNDDAISLFLKSIILNFNSQSEVLQKKSYATTQSLITINKKLFDQHWQTVLIAVSTSSSNVQPAAHKARLSLCRSLYSHLENPLAQKQVLTTLPSLLSEAILATKEGNNKLRIAGLDLVIAIGVSVYNSGITMNTNNNQQQQSPSQPIDKNNLASQNPIGQQLLTQYLTMILAGLAATTPRMLSATINVLARLVFEFKTILSHAIIHDIFQTIMILISSHSREILKSILAFIKVVVVALPHDIFRTHVRELLYGISDWRQQERSHFKRNVRILYQLLLKRFGLDFVRENTPPDDTRLVEYLRKQQVRQQNQKDRERKEGKNNTTDIFSANKDTKDKKGKMGGEDDDEDDFIDVHRYHHGLSFDEIVQLDNDDADDLGFSAAEMLEKSVKGNTKNKKSKKLNDLDSVTIGDETDFLDMTTASKLRSKLNKKNKGNNDMDDDVDLMTNDSSKATKRKATTSTTSLTADGKLDFKNLEKHIKDEEQQQRLAARQPTQKELDDKRKKQRLLLQQHKEENMEIHAKQNKLRLGSEFTSARGAGDVKRKGTKYDPYAYVPLDPRTLNTKKLSLRQQSKHFASMFENNAPTTLAGGQKGPGQRLTRAQRAAVRKKGGKGKKVTMEDE